MSEACVASESPSREKLAIKKQREKISDAEFRRLDTNDLPQDSAAPSG